MEWSLCEMFWVPGPLVGTALSSMSNRKFSKYTECNRAMDTYQMKQ